MRKCAFVLAMLMVAGAPATALAAKKSAAPADPNAAGRAFVRAMFMQPVLAWQAAVTPKTAAKKK